MNPKHYCMKKDRTCRFDYPKRLHEETMIPRDGYAVLKRPFGRSVVISGTFTADNSWIVPHNKFLLMKYDAHINVEASASILAIKYMFKYVCKGDELHCELIFSLAETANRYTGHDCNCA